MLFLEPLECLVIAAFKSFAGIRHTKFQVFAVDPGSVGEPSSMNQTNRQFVQVPAFHLPSFNLPPQLMAYYTVLSQCLREVLQDDEGTIYGLAISPNLSNILSVSCVYHRFDCAGLLGQT